MALSGHLYLAEEGRPLGYSSMDIESLSFQNVLVNADHGDGFRPNNLRFTQSHLDDAL